MCNFGQDGGPRRVLGFRFTLWQVDFFSLMPRFALTQDALNSYRKWRGITVFRVTIGKSIYNFCVSRFSQ